MIMCKTFIKFEIFVLGLSVNCIRKCDSWREREKERRRFIRRRSHRVRAKLKSSPKRMCARGKINRGSLSLSLFLRLILILEGVPRSSACVRAYARQFPLVSRLYTSLVRRTLGRRETGEWNKGSYTLRSRRVTTYNDSALVYKTVLYSTRLNG